MRLINADALISRLNDYALQNAPIYGRRQNDSAYDTIQNCIKAVGECESVNCVQEIKRQVENMHHDLSGNEPYRTERWFRIGLDMMYDGVMDIIKHMGCKETGWIPVSERLPEPGRIVMVKQTYGSKEYGPITIGRRKPAGTDCSDPYWEFLQYRKDFRDTRITDSGVICPGNKFVIAWMPLTEPYREE